MIQEITSNKFVLQQPNRIGRLSPTRLKQKGRKELLEQFESDGYLWLKNILDRNEVLEFRRKYFQLFQPSGILASGSDPQEGVYSGRIADVKLHRQILNEVHRWVRFEQFCLSKPILEFYEWILGGAIYLNTRKIIRHIMPGSKLSTGVHYDLTYLRGGTDQLFTSWIPVGDIPFQMGGLIYLEHSTSYARKFEMEYREKTQGLPDSEKIKYYNPTVNLSSPLLPSGWLTEDIGNMVEKVNERWLIADYSAGDMVIHSPYMIHASSNNIDSQKRIRLSCDIRFQRLDLPIDVRWSKHLSLDDGI